MNFDELSKSRYSCRSYLAKEVEPEKLDKVLAAAMNAPTAVNAQAFKLMIVKSEDAMAKIKKCTTCTFNAPLVIVAFADIEKPPIKDAVMIDPTIVVTQMALQAAEIGLGTCMVRRFDPQDIIREFNVPEKYLPVLLLPLGYPSEQGVPSPRHFTRKPASELVSFDSINE